MQKPKFFLVGNADYISAILEGRAKQHQIIISPQPIDNTEIDGNFFSGDHLMYVKVDGHPDWRDAFTRQVCKYEAGDILMIKESYRILTDFNAPSNGLVSIEYKVKRPGANDAVHIFNRNELHPKTLTGLMNMRTKPNKWHTGIFLSNDLTRIFVKVTEVRLQRMQEITKGEAILSGYNGFRSGARSLYSAGLDMKSWQDGAIPWYKDRVNELHGPDTWNQNPWVFTVSFELNDTYLFKDNA